MTYIEQSKKKVRDFIANNGWTLFRLSRQSGIRESTLRALHSEKWNPTSSTLHKLETTVDGIANN